MSGPMPSHPKRSGSINGVQSQMAPQSTVQTPYSQSIAKSMTIEEMRQLHHQALREAEAKKTELRLVLASRYRELVGSSDEVLRMRERAEELHELVHALPSLMTKLVQSTKEHDSSATVQSIEAHQAEMEERSVAMVRRDLSELPRVAFRALDKNDVHGAAATLIQLFTLIASQSDDYPLANALAVSGTEANKNADPLVIAQTKMIYLFVETLPDRTCRLAKQVLLNAAAYGDQEDQNPHLGAQRSGAALSALDLLDVTPSIPDTPPQDRAVKLIDLYYDSKAKLLHTLLNQLTTEKDPSTSPKEDATDDKSSNEAATSTASAAEEILSKIVLILQYDVIVHPYQIFILGNFPCSDQSSSAGKIMESLPAFDGDLLKSKASHFLAAHLPLIRTKVKSVLVTIAGTTASALGQIRQSLYDKTDGVECMERLDSNGVCTWEEAVNGMVDVRIVLSHGTSFATTDTNSAGAGAPPTAASQQRKFSLWGALFSNTFSSLVHSLLTTAFHSVHVRVVSTLRTSLANAPPLHAILPHEAYRNTLRIATELDAALLKVSADAHELLVHAEERIESERRLRQSLYVQTCEIMGRLVSELRRMLLTSPRRAGDVDGGEHQTTTDATKELIVGRLCHLLKFRLTSLPTLLNPNSSPAVLHAVAGSSSGMITLLELQSAFDLADDNDDGLITFEEAMEAVDSAFSGTQFHGAEMVRETLLLTSSSSEKDAAAATQGGPTASPRNVTLNELALLSARGLRHQAVGPTSALGIIQQSLDDIIESCFSNWARVALQPSTESFVVSLKDFIGMACTTSEAEWKRIHQPMEGMENDAMLQEIGDALDDGERMKTIDGNSSEPIIGDVSPYVVGYLLSVSSVLNRSVCPSDSLMPVPSAEYATALGISCDAKDCIPNMMDTLRWALLQRALYSVATSVDEEVTFAMTEEKDVMDNGDEADKRPMMKNSSPSALIQTDVDFSFLKLCFFARNKHGYEWRSEQGGIEKNDRLNSVEASKMLLEKAADATNSLMRNGVDMDMVKLSQSIGGKHRHVLEVCDLLLSSLLGEDTTSGGPSVLGDVSADLQLAGSSMGSGAAPLLLNPLPSSRRFVLLPIQSDRSLSELQLRGKYRKDKNEDDKQDNEAFGVVSSGLGFFSSMLKKK